MTAVPKKQRFDLVKETVFNFYNVRAKIYFEYQEKARGIILFLCVLIVLACFVLFLDRKSSEFILVGGISTILFLVFFNFRHNIIVEHITDYAAFLFWGVEMEKKIINQKIAYQKWLVTLKEDIDNMSSSDRYMSDAQKAREIIQMKIEN